MTWTLKKSFRFEASHQLMHHDGKCRRLHGHSWKLVVEITGRRLVEAGAKENMLLDYDTISSYVKPIIDERLDHHHLNDTLDTHAPTSEFIARWLYLQLLPFFSIHGKLAVTIEETCTSSCRYTEE